MIVCLLVIVEHVIHNKIKKATLKNWGKKE